MNSTHRHPVRRAHLVLLILAGCLLALATFCFGPFAMNGLRVLWWDLGAPRPLIVNGPTPERVVEFPDRMPYRMEWSPSAREITIMLSNWTSSGPDAPSTVARIDLESRELSYSEEAEDNAVSGEPPLTVPAGFDPRRAILAQCPPKGVSALAYGFEGERYFLSVTQQDDLTQTYEFGSDQWPVDYLTPLAGLSFSPDCDRITVSLSGWVAYEGEGREELWGLDIASGQFGLLLIGRSLFGIVDYPVETVRPSWSPDANRFAFGGGEFGISVFDFGTRSRASLLAPRFNAYEPVWSPSGDWIVAVAYQSPGTSLLLVSTDGSLLHMDESCEYVDMPTWAPFDDRLAYVCTRGCSSSLAILDLR
jgi:WD40 repeat protein